MSRSLLIASFLVLLFQGFATSAEPPGEIKALVAAYDKAWLEGDSQTLEKILSDNYQLFGFDGESLTKTKVLEDVETGEVKFEVAESSDEKFRTFGNTIVWTGIWHEKGTNKGVPFQNKGPFTTVLAKDGGDWKIVSDQVTRLVSKAEPNIDGSWQLFGRLDDDGNVFEITAEEKQRVTTKYISDGKWCISFSDRETGEVVYHHGGSYTLDGNTYIERIEFANENTQSMMGERFKFKMEVDGDTLKQRGVGNPYNEVWKRSKPKKKQTKD